jgi:rhamnogalacturonan endolyase
MRKKAALIAAVMCFTTGVCSVSDFSTEPVMTVSAVSSSVTDRGLTAINTGSGMLVSWKYMTADTEDAVYNLYRDDTLIYTSNKNDATCYLDSEGNSSSKYRVDTVIDGNVKYSDNCSMISDTDYFQINLDVPEGQTSGVTYSPNDCTIGDADGDGTNEIFVKWDPSNSKDNSQKGKTDKVFIDCYKLDGTKLWRIDLGINIRAGAHYTQMLVADFDNDGYAELTCKTSDGTVDGTGKVIGDASADYRNSDGYILTGNEYYTLFDGRTGAALDTVNYNPSRGTVSKWGDKYGNRVDRFLGAVMYLDEDHPSAVTVRGYYTRMTACAYDVVDKKLVQRWYFDTGNDSSAVGYGDGNHNCMPADVDGDGKQELVLGSTCIDDNGTVLWNLNKGHGDALHVGDFLPDRSGLEVWICHEDSPYGVSLVDAATGDIIFHKDGSSDTGRCCADNVWAGNDGAEFWGLGNDVFDGTGTVLSSMKRPAINFLCYWDGDLEREILDGYTDSPATVSKVEKDGKISTLKTTDEYYTCNTTKGTPCLSGDILGDWREEIVVRAADSKSIRIYCTSYETSYRINTLMEDRQYYTQVLGENIAYNQPPHLSYYLGSDRDIPSGTGTVPSSVNKTAVLPEGAVFMIKNVNSGLYMQVAENSASNGANVQQSSSDGAVSGNMWRVVSADDGYYYLYSQVDGKGTYCLDVTAKKTDNGTNMEIYTSKQNDAQKFKFIENEDGSYKILTKVSGDKSCVEVADASSESGANVQQWEINGANCQDWILEQVTDPGCIMDTSKIYMFRNADNGLYMDVTGGVEAEGTNVQVWGAENAGAYNTWTLGDAGNGYYYIYSQLGDGKTYYLDIADGKSASGTNAGIWTDTKSSAQLFKFRLNSDGSYKIMTKASKDNCCLSVSGSGNGANVQQETMDNSVVQNWILEIVGEIETPVTTTEETNAPVTTAEETNAPVITAEETKITDIPETTTELTDTVLLGDVNCDSAVDVRDATLLKQSVVKLITLNDSQKANADVISDGIIDVKDLGQLLKYIIKVIDKF